MRRSVPSLMLAFALTVLTSCSGSDGDNGASATTTPPESTVTEPEAPSPAATDLATTTSTSRPPPTTTLPPVSLGGNCVVADSGGGELTAFSALAYEGAQRVADALNVQILLIEPSSEDEYEAEIQALVDTDCDLIVTVGLGLAEATRSMANANPEQPFAIVDFSYADGDIVNANVKEMVFAVEEPAFVAGYLAAAMTQTGVVGTFGGSEIPSVTVFMDGFVGGVQHYNDTKGASITVLGWDAEARRGLFTNDFASIESGRALAERLVADGADIIMPVAGQAGVGAAMLAQELGSFSVVGVDVDGAVWDPDHADVYLTSVLKKVDNAVFAVSADAASDDFTARPYTGSLANGGVGLADFHGWADRIPDGLKAEIENLARQIVDGVVRVPVG